MERTNLRALRLADIGGAPVDLVTLDLSFISLLKVVDAVCDVLKPDGELVVLIKPQFEAGKEQVGGGAGRGQRAQRGPGADCQLSRAGGAVPLLHASLAQGSCCCFAADSADPFVDMRAA
jgi:hypothetical protein